VTDQSPSRVARRLGLGDAVLIGLGSMTGQTPSVSAMSRPTTGDVQASLRVG
jgi:hypothetical protein